MTIDPALPTIVFIMLITLVTTLLLKILKQPHLVAYIIVGAIIGPHGLGLVENIENISRIGAIGVVLLLFFVGTELSPSHIISGWRVSLVGTFLQILLSVFAVWLVGLYFGWPMGRIVLLGFVISLTSTAVVLNIAQNDKSIPPKIANGATSITIMQDIALIPMLVIIGLMAGTKEEGLPLSIRLSGATLMLVIAIAAIRSQKLRLPFERFIAQDREMQTLAAFSLCLGLALLSASIGLSTALGAFVAGLVVTSLKATEWVKHSIEPFRHVFMAIFFVSVGMIMDMSFMSKHWQVVLFLLVAVILTNTFVNALALRFSGFTWREALYAGTILSQVGEFSFVLAAIGMGSGLITEYAYQATISIIALSLLISPMLISTANHWYHRKATG